MVKIYKIIGCVFVSLFISNLGFAWGKTGHRVIANVAENHLTPEVKAKINSILNHKSLAQISTWADDIKADKENDYGRYRRWHYMTLKKPDSDLDDSLSIEPKDLYSAILYCIDLLSHQDKYSALQIEVALKLLVHLVGDIHQPLHVGNGEDYGANNCYVHWFGSKYKSSLHTVWDSKIIDHTKLSYSEYTNFLDKVDLNKITQWQQTPVADWARESRSQHASIYPIFMGIGPSTYCKIGPNNEIAKTLPMLGFAYIYEHQQQLDIQLLKAGVRLAGLLNKLFA